MSDVATPCSVRVEAPPLQPGVASAGMAAVNLIWVPAGEWDALEPGWQALAEAGEGAAFLFPGFALPARGIDRKGLGALVVTRDGAWIGFAAGRFTFGGAVFTLWSHPYAPFGGLLCLPHEAGAVMTTLMEELARRGVTALHWPLADDAGWNAARASLVDRRVVIIDRHARAILTMAAPPLSKEQRRLARRLGETGRIEHVSTTTGHDLDDAFDAFLVLEARGWKGRAGTAMGSAPHTEIFFREAVLGLGRSGRASIDLMLRDGAPIAAGVVFRAGERAWYLKTAYDEAFARYSPGVLLSHALGNSLIAEPGIRLVDSCAIQDHPMIDRIWPERMTITSRLIAVQPGRPDWRFHAVLALRMALDRGRALAKRVLKGAKVRLARARAGG